MYQILYHIVAAGVPIGLTPLVILEPFEGLPKGFTEFVTDENVRLDDRRTCVQRRYESALLEVTGFTLQFLDALYMCQPRENSKDRLARFVRSRRPLLT